jgi:hypothetical protein
MFVSATRHVCGDACVKYAIAPIRHHVDESRHGAIEQGINGWHKPFADSCPRLPQLTIVFLAPPLGVGGRDKPGHDAEIVASIVDIFSPKII